MACHRDVATLYGRASACRIPVLTVNEIFHSIQGESTYAGRPCVFVRLTACDLRCTWCDTPYAFHEGRKMPSRTVARRGRALRLHAGRGHRRRAAAAAGGLSADAARCSTAARPCCIETGGHRIDCRRAGRRRQGHGREVPRQRRGRAAWTGRNLDRLAPTRRGEVRDRGPRRLRVRDARSSRATRLAGKRRRGALLAGARRARPEDARRMGARRRLPVRVQLQVHKYIWAPETRGV